MLQCVVHRLDRSVCFTTNNRIPHLKRSLLHKQTGYDSLSLMNRSIKANAGCSSIRVRPNIMQLRNCQKSVKKFIDTLSCSGTCLHNFGVTTPFRWQQFIGSQLLKDSINICSWQIYLIDCNNNRDVCCTNMTNCFFCLRHDSIVSCNDKYCTVGYVRSPSPHLSESFVTRCINK